MPNTKDYAYQLQDNPSSLNENSGVHMPNVSTLRATEGRPASRRSIPMKKLTINLPQKVYDELEHIAYDSGRTMTDVIRQALAVIAVAIAEEKAGNKLVIARKDNTPIKDIVLPR